MPPATPLLRVLPSGASAAAGAVEIRPWLAPALLLAAALAVHGAWFMRPMSVVFDEVYFGRDALDYLSGTAFFDLHPPLGKLIFAAMAWLLGLDPHFSFPGNGVPFPGPGYALLRLPADLGGVLFPLLLYGTARELGLSRWAALVLGLLAALDNAWLVISRFTLIDIFFIDFGFAALWCYLRHHRLGGAGWLVAAALFAGASASVKWTGLSFLGGMLVLEALRGLRTRDPASGWRLALLVGLPVLFYLGVFALHFALLGAAAEGPGGGFFEHFLALNRRMYTVSSGMLGKHAYASRWYDWPFMMRPLDFWAEYRGPVLARIYLLGNPIVWWTSAYCMLYLLVNAVPKLPGLLQRRWPAPAELFIVGGFLANLLPFTQIRRVMFIYHYLPAQAFALLGVGLLLDRSARQARCLGAALLLSALAAFVYFAPLSYGLELTQAQFDARFWVDSWK
jgi:dolichyl-phosphate-mannose--protein O-mannosyl transferase